MAYLQLLQLRYPNDDCANSRTAVPLTVGFLNVTHIPDFANGHRDLALAEQIEKSLHVGLVVWLVSADEEEGGSLPSPGYLALQQELDSRPCSWDWGFVGKGVLVGAKADDNAVAVKDVV